MLKRWGVAHLIDIRVEVLKPGMYLAENVVSPLGGVILYKETRIEEYHKELLSAFTISSVKIEPEKKETVEEFLKRAYSKEYLNKK